MHNFPLLKQKKITENEIEQRCKLLSLHPDKLQELTRHYFLIEDCLDTIAMEFVQFSMENGQIACKPEQKQTHITALHHAIKHYVMELLSETLNIHTVNNSIRVGLLHQQFNKEPKFYLSALLLLKNLILEKLKLKIPSVSQFESLKITLDKLFYFDIALFFDAYIHLLQTEIAKTQQAIEHYSQNLERQVAERTQELVKQVQLDPLTHLYNQKAMRELAQRELQIAKRQKNYVSIIYFDIDDFKQINDSLGHLKGDEILKIIGDILLNNTRETDIACRYGGDEFCVILRECQQEDARHFCQKIIACFSQTCPTLSLSFGITETGPEDFNDINRLIDEADRKMYQAKKVPGFSIC